MTESTTGLSVKMRNPCQWLVEEKMVTERLYSEGSLFRNSVELLEWLSDYLRLP